ncbi:TIR domain-containing protein [Actinokineospora sp. NPDC004072]
MVEAAYDVCLSFAGDQRPYVDEVAKVLRAHGVRVFYDDDERADLWGRDLAAHLTSVYADAARYCVLFASAAYARRRWTDLERRAILARVFRDGDGYLLPVRFDDTPIPGVVETTGHVDARTTGPPELARLLLAKLGRTPIAPTGPMTIVALSVDTTAVDLDKIADDALARCRMTLAPQLRGRWAQWSALAIPTAQVSDAEVLAALVPALIAVGAPRLTDGSSLRVAVHRGELPAGGWSGPDVDAAVDAATSAAVTDLVARTPGADSAVVVTKQVFDRVVARGRGGANPAAYQAVALADGSVVHVRLPGHPKPGGAAPPPSAAASRTTVFFGPAAVHQIGDVINYGGSGG